jgi:hypothetical protein
MGLFFYTLVFISPLTLSALGGMLAGRMFSRLAAVPKPPPPGSEVHNDQ